MNITEQHIADIMRGLDVQKPSAEGEGIGVILAYMLNQIQDINFSLDMISMQQGHIIDLLNNDVGSKH